MIINFNVENFASIKDKQTLSFEADKSKHLEDYYVIQTKTGHRLLKLGLIYGANASGKSNILKALDFLRELVLNPKRNKTTEIEFNPFLFDNITPNLPSILSIEFLQNDVKYYYEVEFNSKAILKEELINYNPSKAVIFKRTTDTIKQYSEIKFGSKISIDKVLKRTLEANTLSNNTVMGGFLKTNLEFEELKEVNDWFSYYLFPIVHTRTILDSFVTKNIHLTKINFKNVLEILRKADFNISYILIKEKEEEKIDGSINTHENELEANIDGVNVIKRKDKDTSVSVELEHLVNANKYTLPFELESQGTQRYYGLAGLLSLLISSSVSIPIDELESSLHPDLFTHFLLAFLINSKHSQLISTTHNREILNNKDIFRNDVIWFTNKNEQSATELYSLSDFDSAVIRDTTSIYNAYKIGKLGAVPNLSDYFLDINNEK